MRRALKNVSLMPSNTYDILGVYIYIYIAWGEENYFILGQESGVSEFYSIGVLSAPESISPF